MCIRDRSYTYHDIPVGSVRVNFSVNREENSLFDIQPDGEVLPQESDQPVIFVNVALILIGLGVLVGIVLVWLLIRSILKNYSFGGRSNRRKRKNRRKQRSAGGYRDIDF